MQHALVPALAQAGIFVAQVVVDQSDALTSAVGQATDHMLGGIDIVNPDAGDRPRIGVFGALHPGGIANQRRQLGKAGKGVHGDNAVDHFAGQQAQSRAGAFNIGTGVTEQNTVAIFLRLRLNALHHLGAERVGNIGDHHQDHIAARGAQLTSQKIGLVVSLFNRLQDAIAVFGFDGIAVIQHARYRRHRDARQLGDFLN